MNRFPPRPRFQSSTRPIMTYNFLGEGRPEKSSRFQNGNMKTIESYATMLADSGAFRGKVTPSLSAVEPHRQEPRIPQHMTCSFSRLQKVQHSHSDSSTNTATIEIVHTSRKQNQPSPPKLSHPTNRPTNQNPLTLDRHVCCSKKHSPYPPRRSWSRRSRKRSQALQDSRNRERDAVTIRPIQHSR